MKSNRTTYIKDTQHSNAAVAGQAHSVTLSKSLSWLLRHGAPKEKKITVHPGGYVNVTEILSLPKFSRYTESDIRTVVENNDKKRFTLVVDDGAGQLRVRANQGHTFPVNEEDLLELIQNPDDYPLVVHGTYRRFWESIRETGLSRMRRNHIHFAPGEPGTDGVISGMRLSAEIYIYIDLKQAMKDGIKFYRSDNSVILTSGDSQGYLSPKYFSKVKDVKKNEYLKTTD